MTWLYCPLSRPSVAARPRTATTSPTMATRRSKADHHGSFAATSRRSASRPNGVILGSRYASPQSAEASIAAISPARYNSRNAAKSMSFVCSSTDLESLPSAARLRTSSEDFVSMSCSHGETQYGVDEACYGAPTKRCQAPPKSLILMVNWPFVRFRQPSDAAGALCAGHAWGAGCEA